MHGRIGSGAIIAVRRLRCAVLPAENQEIMRAAAEIEHVPGGLVFVSDTRTFDDYRKSRTCFHLPQQLSAARVKTKRADIRRHTVGI